MSVCPSVTYRIPNASCDIGKIYIQKLFLLRRETLQVWSFCFYVDGIDWVAIYEYLPNFMQLLSGKVPYSAVAHNSCYKYSLGCSTGQEDEEEDVGSYCMTLEKGEDCLIWRRKLDSVTRSRGSSVTVATILRSRLPYSRGLSHSRIQDNSLFCKTYRTALGPTKAYGYLNLCPRV